MKKRSTEQRTVSSFCRRMAKDKINLQPSYQRDAVWGRPQKQFLIDTILRDLDIPKIYLRDIDTPESTFEEEVVDGQQRLTAIYGFHNDEYALAKDADNIDSKYEIRGKKFTQLDEYLKDNFESYELTAILLRNSNEDEIEEMFLRLQNGSPLNAAEKRNAMKGKMKAFIRETAKHKFFEQRCGFKNSRFAYDLVAAQMTKVIIAGGPCAVRGADLVKMYKNNEDFDSNAQVAKQIRKTLDVMFRAFPVKTPELSKLNSLSVFILFRYLGENFYLHGREVDVYNWFITFENWRKNDEKRPADEREPEMVDYHDKVSRATDSQASVVSRHAILLTRLLKDIPNLTPLDPQRSFTHEQRMAIHRRDMGICQVRLKCEGEECHWDHWHADHKIAHSKGGKTTVENGQVACVKCNLVKNAN
jgi:hypothetical protein